MACAQLKNSAGIIYIYSFLMDSTTDTAKRIHYILTQAVYLLTDASYQVTNNKYVSYIEPQ